MSQKVDLHTSWKEKSTKIISGFRFDHYEDKGYISGASDFQKRAIEALEKQVSETSNLGDYNQGIIRGLNRAINIIKNLKV